jgi:hypothetical protein
MKAPRIRHRHHQRSKRPMVLRAAVCHNAQDLDTLLQSFGYDWYEVAITRMALSGSEVSYLVTWGSPAAEGES